MNSISLNYSPPNASTQCKSVQLITASFINLFSSQNYTVVILPKFPPTKHSSCMVIIISHWPCQLTCLNYTQVIDLLSESTVVMKLFIMQPLALTNTNITTNTVCMSVRCFIKHLLSSSIHKVYVTVRTQQELVMRDVLHIM